MHNHLVIPGQSLKSITLHQADECLWRNITGNRLRAGSQVLIQKSKVKLHANYLCPIEKLRKQDFPGGPVAKTPRSQCRGPGFNLRAGN